MSIDARLGQRTEPASWLLAAWRRLPVLCRAALLVAAFLLTDMCAPILIDRWRFSLISAILTVIFGAIVISQLGLLAIWAAFGPQRWYARLSLSLALALLGCASFYTGAGRAGAYPGDVGQFVPVAATLP